MATSEEIFADSNYFVSSFNPEDTKYHHALQVSAKLDSENASLVITNFIFAEVVTVLSQRQGRQTAIQTGQYLLSHPNIRTVHVDEYLQNAAWHIFQDSNDKNISLVDSSIIATMKSEGIQKLLTFDTTDFTKLQDQYRFSFYD